MNHYYHTVIQYEVFLSNTNLHTELYDFKYSYVISIFYTQLYGFK